MPIFFAITKNSNFHKERHWSLNSVLALNFVLRCLSRCTQGLGMFKLADYVLGIGKKMFDPVQAQAKFVLNMTCIVLIRLDLS